MEEEMFMITEPFMFHIGKEHPSSVYVSFKKTQRCDMGLHENNKKNKRSSVSAGADYNKAKRLISEKFWNLHITSPSKKSRQRRSDDKSGGKNVVRGMSMEQRQQETSESNKSFGPLVSFPFSICPGRDQIHDQIEDLIRKSRLPNSHAVVPFIPFVSSLDQEAGEPSSEQDVDEEMQQEGIDDITIIIDGRTVGVSKRLQDAVDINDSEDIVEIPRFGQNWGNDASFPETLAQEELDTSFVERLEVQETFQSSGEGSSSFPRYCR